METLDESLNTDCITQLKEEVNDGNIIIGRKWEKAIQTMQTGKLKSLEEENQRTTQMNRNIDIIPEEVHNKIIQKLSEKLKLPENMKTMNKLLPNYKRGYPSGYHNRDS